MNKHTYFAPSVETIELIFPGSILTGSQTDSDSILSPLDGTLGDFEWTVL